LNQKGNFWVRFFHNSLLFLDIFIYGQWIHTNADKIVSEFFHYERDELRASLVRVIAVASHANHRLEVEERKLLEYFLQSTGLSTERKKECWDIFEHGLPIEELNLPTNNSWILKKYFLEIAILTFWADKQVEQMELELLNRLAASISFHADDVENSLLAVEGFVLENWKELEALQDKKSYEEVSRQFVERMAMVTAKNKSRLLQEVRSWNELTALLNRARSRELDTAEKENLRLMLVDVLKRIPTFVFISLPQQFLTLPILMQILPKNFIAETLNA
jgi:LETM1-like protein